MNDYTIEWFTYEHGGTRYYAAVIDYDAELQDDVQAVLEQITNLEFEVYCNRAWIFLTDRKQYTSFKKTFETYFEGRKQEVFCAGD